jgi:uncharacterized membrane protein (UPF0182 family)
MPRLGVLIALGIFALIAASSSASFVIDYEWWKEMGQLDTWFSMAAYRYLPRLAVAVLTFLIFRAAFALGRRRARAMAEIVDLEPGPGNPLPTLVIAGVSLLVSMVLISPWTIIQFAGGHSTASASAWRDPLFGQPLSFYLFDLPFYTQIVNGAMFLLIAAILIYFVSSIPLGEKTIRVEFATPMRWLLAVAILTLAARLYLGRYDLLTAEHGFLTGADYVDEKIRLPLQWFAIFAAIASAALVAMGRYFSAAPLPILAMALRVILPSLVSSFYVKPNEISLEKPYIERHIAATLAAYGLDRNVKETEFAARSEVKIDFVKNKSLLENVRLWDWQAFKDTVSQVQPLRPYSYKDVDVDRYRIDGVTRQLMIAPRELDIEQLGEARNQWINPHFVYTHGYGLVAADANRITANGLPVLYIQDAPPNIKTTSLKLSRPQIYYGEIGHEPVFVNTAQQEFDYPSGADNVHTNYQGKRGIPMTSVWMRLLAALNYGDRSILFTGLLTGDSRMLIHRTVSDRLDTLANFIEWDTDPYLVITKDGRLVWIVDGYLTSDAHPYSRRLRAGRFSTFNYMRNSVKATVDAYDGSTQIFVVDPTDPVVRTYQNLFPKLFQEASAIPEDLREHLRYGERMFEAQAEIYRTYHMREPEAFYNKADLWDPARYVARGGAGAQNMEPTFVMAALPGEKDSEFLLVLPFSPRGKDNLAGYMAARCDPAHYGEVVFLQMPKQEILLGPMQLEARIDQDQTISKDLSLWNQQGSTVLRGQTLILPVDGSLLYVKPLYLQASNARMPQLKKVVVAMGNQLVYEDTYEQALASLSNGAMAMKTAPATAAADPSQPPVAAPPQQPLDAKTQSILDRVQRLRRELDALEVELKKR